MADGRTWAFFASGVATGGAAIGIYMWRSRRPPPVGRIYKIKSDYYADSAVVEALLSRSTGAERYGKGSGGEIFLYQRGRVRFEGPIGDGDVLPEQVGPGLFRIDSVAAAVDVENLVIEWIWLGLALPGAAFATWPHLQGGRWNPPPAPLHPTALDPKRKAISALPPLRDDPVAHPIGHYFKAGEHYYADDNFLRTLDGFRGADFDQQTNRTIVPFWGRGHLALIQQTKAKIFAEQVGELYRIEAQLSGVSLANLLIELEGLGLVFWGGQWPRFPERPAAATPTGPVWWGMRDKQLALVFEKDGRFFIDREVLRRLYPRVPFYDTNMLVWQGVRLRLTQVRGDGSLLRVETEDGNTDDDAIRAFIGQILLHRLGERATAEHTARVLRPADATTGAAPRPRATGPDTEGTIIVPSSGVGQGGTR